jgi:hypothetical protein
MGINNAQWGGSRRCLDGCTCGKHQKRPMPDAVKEKIGASHRGVAKRHGKNCGCFRCLTPDVSVHGNSSRSGNTPEYNAWKNMRARCRDSGHPSFKYYGGRGISVDPRWESFTVFLADVGPRPGSGYSIDRTDNDGNYEPGNVRWATRSEQRRNMRPVVQKHQVLSPEDFDWIKSGIGLVSNQMMAEVLGVSVSTVWKITRRLKSVDRTAFIYNT